jgi:hypothetical protein
LSVSVATAVRKPLRAVLPWEALLIDDRFRALERAWTSFSNGEIAEQIDFTYEAAVTFDGVVVPELPELLDLLELPHPASAIATASTAKSDVLLRESMDLTLPENCCGNVVARCAHRVQPAPAAATIAA